MANIKNNDDGYNLSVYRIPHNFSDSGRVLGGMVSLRNLIESAVLGYLMYKFEFFMFWDWLGPKFCVIIMLATISPLVIAAFIGINGDCFTKFIQSLFVFIKNRRKMRFRRIYNEKKDL